MAKRPDPAGIAPAAPPLSKAEAAVTRTLRCRTVATGRFRQLNYIRDLPPQPEQDGPGTGLLDEDLVPNASEVLLAAFGSCLAIGIHANAVAQRIAVRSLELELEADINTTAAWAPGDLQPQPIGFEAVRVLVHLDAEAPRAMLVALIKHATLWSPVANTLHNPVHLDVTLQAA